MDSLNWGLAAVSEYLPQAWLTSRRPPEASYEYQSLEADHIRILTLEPGSRSAPIRCSFRSVARDEAASTFTALSYCWGSMKNPRIILVGNHRLSVGPNLYHALVALRKENESHDFWIDAVCIDQGNIPEKSEQIMHMDQIYSSASHVIIWLGPAGDDSDYIVERILDQRTDEFAKKRFIEGMLAILGRPWFRRTWIVQEFMLNPRALLVACGLRPLICWDCFMAAYDATFPFVARRSLTVQRAQQQFNPSYSTRHSLAKVTQYSSVMVTLRSLRDGFQSKLSPGRRAFYDLRYLLYATRPFLATDSRDKIYGMLALVSGDARNHGDIKSDYKKTVEDVFRDATMYLLKEEKTTTQYAFAPLRPNPDLNLPSWVPDFSAPQYTSPSKPWVHSRGTLELPEHRAEDVRVSSCGRQLGVKGLILDKVERLIEAPPPRKTLSPRAYPQLILFQLVMGTLYLLTLGNFSRPTLEYCIERIKQRAEMIALSKALVDIERLVQERAEQSGKSPVEPLWKTLLVSLSDEERFQNQEECQAKFERLMAVARDFATQGPHAWWIINPRFAAFEATFPASAPVSNTIRTTFVAGRSFFVSRGGWYGVGEGDLRKGDRLALLFPDANVPFILRKSGDCYKMLGMAHVPETMRSEAVSFSGGVFTKLTII